MSEVITIFQDYKQNIIKYSQHFPVIEEFKQVFGEQNLVLQTDGSIQIKNYVGFFQKGKTQVQVLPKIYSGSKIEEDEIKNSLEFLFRLLSWSRYLSFKDLDELDITSNQLSVFEIFIRIFAKRFLFEFNRSPHYEYITRIENQQIIKGKILFSETIKRNSYNSHLHIVEFDDFSVNNKLNQLFKFVFHELIKTTLDGKNRMLLKQGITMLEDVDYAVVTQDWFRSIQFNRQNNRYKTLYNFAKLFFYNNQPGLSSGKEHTFSFLVPLNLLFEASVNIFLKDIENRVSNIKLKYHSTKYFGKEEAIDRFQLEPDFVFNERKTGRTIAILDTKFKNPFDKEGNPAISDSDLYQLTTYASAYNCNHIFLIYPHFYNTPKINFLTKYILKTRTVFTELSLIQIDITKKDIDEIKADLLDPITNILNSFYQQVFQVNVPSLKSDTDI